MSRTQLLRCPICLTGSINVAGESDEVECACPECGGHFTAGEARRGQLYVEQRKIENRLDDFERRILKLERATYTPKGRGSWNGGERKDD